MESFAPGAVVSGVARRHGLSPQQLFTWRRQARRGDLVVSVSDEVPFFPILPTPMDAEAEGVEPPPSAEMIEIVLGGAVVRVPPEVDGKLLAKVLRAVKAMA
jgi:transposase